jgi:NADH-quinone oxidoreductase subunit J
MLVVHIIFYVFAALAVLSALVVVTVRNPVRSVLALVVTFFAMAGVWMLLSAEFLSLILLLVYVGAVMTLFLFVVMMLNVDVSGSKEGFTRYLPFGIFLVLLMVALMIVAFGPKFGLMPIPAPHEADYSNITQLGSVLYTEYAYPFEISGVLLLAAIVAAISLAHRSPKRRKSQNIGEQLKVRREDRVRLVKMPSEKKNDLSK